MKKFIGAVRENGKNNFKKEIPGPLRIMYLFIYFIKKIFIIFLSFWLKKVYK